MKKLFAYPPVLLFFISLLPLWSLATSGLPVTHDGQDHVARIANFYQSLTEGILIPRWAANLNWGYGHPILMFLYPLPSYVASLFRFAGLSFVDSTKLVFAVAYTTSVLLFYLWATKQWDKNAGFVGALLYGFAPYRFVDLYVRGAIGEHVAFVFPPIVFLGLLGLARGKDRWAGVILSLGTAGLILSHNAVSLMVLPVAALYAGYLLVFESKQRMRFLLWSVFSVALGFTVSAFFWGPAFFEGKYTLRAVVTKGEFADRFVQWRQFFFMPWSWGGSDELTKDVGIVHWIAVISAIGAALVTRKKPHRWFIFLFTAVFIIVLLLMTSVSTLVWERAPLLQNFQFPWRFLTLTVLLTAMIGGAGVFSLKKTYTAAACVLIAIGVIISTRHMWHAKSFVVKPESFYSGIYESTTDTGESSPIWSVRFMEQRPKAPAEVIEGTAVIHLAKRTSTRHEYSIQAITSSRIVENTLYFPGWRVFVDGKEVPVEFQDPAYRGRMTYDVATGVHGVVVEFTDTKLRKAANLVSLAGLGVLVVLFGRALWEKRR